MKQKDESTKSVFTAAIIGAAVGAAAVALSHRPTRKKVKDSLVTAIETGDQKLDEAHVKMKGAKSKAKKRAVKELGKAQKKLANS